MGNEPSPFEAAARKLAAGVKKGFAAQHPLSEKQRRSIRSAVILARTHAPETKEQILESLIVEARMILSSQRRNGLELAWEIPESEDFERKFAVPPETARWLRRQVVTKLPGIKREVVKKLRVNTKPRFRKRKSV